MEHGSLIRYGSMSKKPTDLCLKILIAALSFCNEKIVSACNTVALFATVYALLQTRTSGPAPLRDELRPEWAGAPPQPPQVSLCFLSVMSAS